MYYFQLKPVSLCYVLDSVLCYPGHGDGYQRLFPCRQCDCWSLSVLL